MRELYWAAENPPASHGLGGLGEPGVETAESAPAALFLEIVCAVTRPPASSAAAAAPMRPCSARPLAGLCSGNGGSKPVHNTAVGSSSPVPYPQDAPEPLMRPHQRAPALSGHTIKPNKAQGTPQGPRRDAHSNWQQASGSPGAKDYVLAAGRAQEGSGP